MKNQKRDKFGRFSASSKSSQRKPIVKKKNISIRNGSIYSWRGLSVRVRKDLNNGLKLVSIHNNLFGFAKPEELELIDRAQVEEYLQ